MEALLRVFLQSYANSDNIDTEKIEKLNSTIREGIVLLNSEKLSKDNIEEYMKIHQQSCDIMKTLYIYI